MVVVLWWNFHFAVLSTDDDIRPLGFRISVANESRNILPLSRKCDRQTCALVVGTGFSLENFEVDMKS
jgi:hypothetical protein